MKLRKSHITLLLLGLACIGTEFPAAYAAKVIKASPVATKERLVLMPLRLAEEDRVLQGAMESALTEGLQRKYEVFSGERVQHKAREIFNRETRSSKGECDETRCMQDIAMAFQSELIASANVAKRPDGYFISITVQNIFDNKVVYSKALPCKGCDAYQVVDKLRVLAVIESTSHAVPAAVAEQEVIEKPLLSPAAGKRFRDCNLCPEMMTLPAGNFNMGVAMAPRTKPSEPANNRSATIFEKIWINGDAADEARNDTPQHRVQIAKPFAIGIYEVTQEEWQDVMGRNPSYFTGCGGNCPVENVGWNEVQEFIRKLNRKTGKSYRLPSEAEWEYACQAGTNLAYCGSDDESSVAWHEGNSSSTTHPAGKKKANAFGLFDMSGNVAEMVEDSYHEDYTGAPVDGSVWAGHGSTGVYRGGSWFSDRKYLRVTAREGKDNQARDTSYGFRLARDLP